MSDKKVPVKRPHFYAKSTNHFYHPDVHTAMPNDAVEVSDELYARVRKGQRAGLAITADSHGFPSAVSHVLSMLVPEGKKHRLKEINAKYSEAILAPFVSKALGKAHTYEAKQMDINQLVVAHQVANLHLGEENWSTVLNCADLSNTWDQRAHSPEQVQQVLYDLHVHHVKAVSKRNDLQKKVKAATTVEDLQKIVW